MRKETLEIHVAFICSCAMCVLFLFSVSIFWFFFRIATKCVYVRVYFFLRILSIKNYKIVRKKNKLRFNLTYISQ
jgi:hypothetical protein